MASEVPNHAWAFRASGAERGSDPALQLVDLDVAGNVRRLRRLDGVAAPAEADVDPPTVGIDVVGVPAVEHHRERRRAAVQVAHRVLVLELGGATLGLQLRH